MSYPLPPPRESRRADLPWVRSPRRVRRPARRQHRQDGLPRNSLTPPVRARRRIDDLDALGGEFVSNPVRRRPVLVGPGLVALLEQCVDPRGGFERPERAPERAPSDLLVRKKGFYG